MLQLWFKSKLNIFPLLVVMLTFLCVTQLPVYASATQVEPPDFQELHPIQQQEVFNQLLYSVEEFDFKKVLSLSGLGLYAGIGLVGLVITSMWLILPASGVGLVALGTYLGVMAGLLIPAAPYFIAGKMDNAWEHVLYTIIFSLALAGLYEAGVFIPFIDSESGAWGGIMLGLVYLASWVMVILGYGSMLVHSIFDAINLKSKENHIK